jgi:hypothetical protein
MKVKTITSNDLTPKQLAEALANSTPLEFGHFWFSFNEICEEKKIDLMPFAKALCPEFGANRKKPLRTLFHYMKYFELIDIITKEEKE